MPNSVPISICSNPSCEELIYKGEQVWKKGNDLYCQGKCLIDSFKTEEETSNG